MTLLWSFLYKTLFTEILTTIGLTSKIFSKTVVPVRYYPIHGYYK